jgi:tRNA (guanine37-N1)-methyltransferase
MMRFDVLTLFPEMFTGPLQESIIKRAQERGLISVHLHNIRDYATGRHRITDDAPYGGGGGMVMKPEPIFAAVEAVLGDEKGVPVILLSPQGRLFTHEVARELSRYPRLVLICGRYEGVDERVREHLATDEISIGDYVLSGGELAAMVIIDAVTRLLPGVLGDPGATFEDSYAWGLLEYPHYTRPAVFRGWAVPEVLLSGNHAAIARWRREQALRRTLERRPDLLERAPLTEEDRAFLARLGWRKSPEGDKSTW